jgi:sigma-E factor negative regulatory protein RseA
MKSRLSALMDGELEAHEVAPVLDAVVGDEALRNEWRLYHLIGDAVRREPAMGLDLTQGVIAALQNEPTILAPARTAATARDRFWRGTIAMAAGFGGIAVVGWMALSFPQSTPPSQVVVRTPIAAAQPVLAAAGPVSGRMQEFLVAHQTYSPGGQMQSGTRYVRTVSAGR